MSLKRKSRSLGQLAGLGASSFGASKSNNSNQKSGLLRTTSRNPDPEDQTPSHKKISRTTPKRLKGLVRPRPSSTTPLGRAVFGRSTPKQQNDVINRDYVHDMMALNQSQIIPNRNRTFLMDSQVMYTVGLQCQERSLFLFSDMLLIAKERSSNNIKLKDQVPLSDLWLSNCISDVSEVTLDQSRSFVIGWPITNAVITLSSSSQKEMWWEKLTALIKQERRANPSSTNIQLGYFEQSTNFEHVKNICARREDTANDCINAALKALDLSDLRPGDLQLWVRTKANESPYPLIGHEIPLVIKMHWMRKSLEGQNQKSYEDYKSGTRCSFILRKTGPASTILPSPSQKYTLKKVTSSIRLQNVFRRVSHGSGNSNSKQSEAEQIVKNHKKELANGKLFGHSLEKIPTGKEGVPKSIEMVLLQLLEDGPTTVGIFRRSPNARAMRELRNKLDEDEIIDFKECSVFVTAALLKDFLRSLPDSLLPSETYSAWTEMTKDNNTNEKISAAKRMLSKLPFQCYSLLKHVIYILKEIDNRSQENMMTSSNLAICVGPCILWSSDPQVVTGTAYASDVSRVTKLLIDEFAAIFGADVPAIFQTTSNRQNQNTREKLSTEKPASRTPPLVKPSDSVKPFILQRSYTTLDKSMLDSVLYSDEPKKVSLASLIDDDDDLVVLNGLYDDVDRISSQDAGDSVDTENESDILARRAMHLFPLKNNVDLFWGETPIRHRHHREDNYGRAENGYYKSPHKRRTANQKKRQAPLPPDGHSPKSHSKVVRSNSVNQVRGVDEFVFKPMQWHRSKSTTRLNIATSGGGGGGSSGGGSNTTDDEIQMTILPSDEYGQILVDNYYVETGAGLPQASPNPPDYDETISRQRILRYYRRPEGSTPTSVALSASPRHFQESASSPLNAHQMASLSINENNNGYRSKSDLTPPPPLPPKERPPLPPKQRYSQRSSVGSINDNTYANMTAFYPRFDDDEDLYTAYSVGVDDPPHLPPKETKSPSSASSSLSTAATQTLSMCDAETQTNEDDFYYQDDEVAVDDDLSFRDDLSFDQSGSVDVALPSDDRLSAQLFPVLSPRESPRSSTLAVALPKWSGSPRHYQQQQPQQPHRLYHTSSHHQLLQQQQQQQQMQQHPQVGKDNFHVEKISWSVSQLRSLFNQDRTESGENIAQAYSDQPQHPPLHREPSHYRESHQSHPHHSHRFHPQVGKERSPANNYNNSHYSDENSDEESYV